MRVVSWNVQTGRPNPDGPPALGPVLQVLGPLDADVYAIQELDRGWRRSGFLDQPALLADGLKGELAWGPAVRRAQREYGVALITRGEILASTMVPLSGTREPRVLLIAEVVTAGRRWTIGCTHLSRNRAFAQRQLVRIFDAMAEHPLPRVLLGDLNLVSGEVLPWSTAEGYQLVAGPPTHSTRQARLTRRIDHILLAGAAATTATTHRYQVSDHCAISADLHQGGLGGVA